MGRGGACVPARVALQGRIHRPSPAHDACIFGMETPLRGRSGGHAGSAPTVSFEWISFVWFCLLVGENGAHEPTPSVLYFCQPRVADERRLPWGKSWRGTYAIGIVLFFNSFACVAIIRSLRVVMMCDEKKYNPQGGSLLACIVTQGRLRCTCQPCAIESITATR